MSKCPNIHEVPEFIESYDSLNKEHKYEYEKIKRFLKSDSGHHIGEPLKHQLSPFKSFPKGHKDIRILYILCKDCKGKVLDSEKCRFCKEPSHSMDDAVLFLVGDHPKTYEKEGLEATQEYRRVDEKIAGN